MIHIRFLTIKENRFKFKTVVIVDCLGSASRKALLLYKSGVQGKNKV